MLRPHSCRGAVSHTFLLAEYIIGQLAAKSWSKVTMLRGDRWRLAVDVRREEKSRRLAGSHNSYPDCVFSQKACDRRAKDAANAISCLQKPDESELLPVANRESLYEFLPDFLPLGFSLFDVCCA